MRKTSLSAKCSAISAFSSRADARSWPNGFSMISRVQPLGRAALGDRADERADRARRHGEVVERGCPACRARGRPRRAAREPVLAAASSAIVERAVAHPGRELVPDVLAELVARVALRPPPSSRSRKPSSVSSRAGGADDRRTARAAGAGTRASRAPASACAAVEVARGAEDDERCTARAAAAAAGPRAAGSSAVAVSRGGSSADLTAWPPNWLRSAAFTLAANDSSCREAKRAKSAARDHRHGHVLGDRLGDRPAALAGVLDVALDLLQLAALELERVVRAARAATSGRPSRSARCRRSRAGRGRTRTSPAPRSPRRRPASGRTRSRCGPSSRSGRRRSAPTCA